MDVTGLPLITQHCALLTESAAALAAASTLPPPLPRVPPPPWEEHRHDDTFSYGRRVSSTDGSCMGTHGPKRVRRAGYGVVWGQDHPQNLALPLLGQWQTSQRAELTAALHAVEAHTSGPLLIRTDSAWTMAGALVLLAGYPPDLRWENGDLWRQLAVALASRTPRTAVTFQKVKAHATASHIAQGLITPSEAEGNTRADEHANAGRDRHDPSYQ